MAIKTQEKTIAGRQFRCQQLPARRAMRLAVKLGRLFGPAVTKALGGAGPKATIADLNVGGLSEALTLLFERLTESEADLLISDLLASTFIQAADGTWVELLPVLDLELAGNLKAIFGALAFSVEVNFGDFFGVVRGALPRSTSQPSNG